MNNAKLKKLRAAGWKVGDARDFLHLSNEAVTPVELKLSLAWAVIEEWRRDYNERRPKKQLDGLPPAVYAARMAAQANGADSNVNCY